MLKNETVKTKVLKILRECPTTRYDDMLLCLEYYRRYSIKPLCELSFEDAMRNYKSYGLPCFQSIRRARQGVQASYKELSRNSCIEDTGSDVSPVVVINILQEETWKTKKDQPVTLRSL